MSLKNKLLVALLIIGIIPSLMIGWLMFYKSTQVIDKLLISNMETKLEYLKVQDDNSILLNKEGTSFVLYQGEEMLLEEEYTDYVELLDIANLQRNPRNLQIVMNNGKLGGVIYDISHGRYIFHFVDVNTEHPWIEDVGTIFIKMTLIILTLAVGFSLNLSFNITTGIRRLMDHIKKVEKGELEEQIEVISKDEIGLLTISFNTMMERLNKLINKTYRLEISEQEAKLKALQAQISPHFLYNALDTINWSLIEKGDFETSKILGSLSEILRYSIDFRRGYVTIEEEFHQSENYLRIQKNRFEDRFEYKIYIEETVKKCFIPKLLLQPIVENAVIHGVEKRANGGHIEVQCKEYNQGIMITVENNGPAIAPDKLKEIQQGLKAGKVETGNHIGLVNINNRIKYTYGDAYRLEIHSHQQGTKIIMYIGKWKEPS